MCKRSVHSKQQELQQLLSKTLGEEGSFEEAAPSEEVELNVKAGIPTPPRDPPIQPGMSAEELTLTLQIKELEVRQRELEVEAMQLRVRALELARGAASPASPPNPTSATLSPHDSFEISWHIALVPPFKESEVDSYCNAFEPIAATLHWPRHVWSLLLQFKLVGKAQVVFSRLSIGDSLNYDLVKATVLRAYELVQGVYRQNF